MNKLSISSNNLQKSFNTLKEKKIFKKIIDNPTQSKLVFSFSIPFIVGILHYMVVFYLESKGSLLSSSDLLLVLIIYLGVISIVGFFVYSSFVNSPGESLGIVLSFLVGMSLWVFIFYYKYKKLKQADNVGKQSFICNPLGICKNDGAVGIYDGSKNYRYISSSDNSIPGVLFDVKNQKKCTFTFWLKINYETWDKSNKNVDEILFTNDNNIKVYINNSILYIKIDTNIVLQFTFPFNKWVHYGIVINENVLEIYLNATLVRTRLLDKFILRIDKLYVGKDDSVNTIYYGFPGQMLYLTYINKALSYNDMYNIYKDEYSIISRLKNSIHNNYQTITSPNEPICD